MDAAPPDTELYLSQIRQLTLETYKLSYERNSDRVRVGAIGPNVPLIIPEAVEIVPKRTLPPAKKGEKPIVIENVPVVHEQTLFMYGVGATQELANMLDNLTAQVNEQLDIATSLEGEISKLEMLTSESSDGGAEIRMRNSAAEAKIIRSEMDLEMQRAEDELSYAEENKKAEIKALERSEQLTLKRLAKEDESARLRAQLLMNKKVETAQLLEKARERNAEELSKAEHERELEIQRAKELMKAETAKAVAKAKAEAERANEDVKLRMLRAEGEQRRIRNVAAVREAFVWLGNGFSSLLQNPRDILVIIGYFALLALAVYFSKEAAGLFRTIVESMIGKPKLVRETTKKNIRGELWAFFQEDVLGTLLLRKRFNRKNLTKKCEQTFSDVVLPDDLKSRIVSLAISAAKAREHDAPHRHVLLYGSPGTGKTLVAKKLAETVGMDYALMSGGDVGPLGADGVTQIHSLFRWAKVSRKGVLLFIDEAEAFLGSRSQNMMSESAHNALNALLYNTGGERKDFMLVLATNRAEDLDAAVLDRCDESLLFPLPNESCRENLLSLYFSKHVVEAANKVNKREGHLWKKLSRKIQGKEKVELVIDELALSKNWLKKGVEITKNFSGREISKLMIAIQGMLYGSKNGSISLSDVVHAISRKVKEHEEKAAMVKAGVGG